jgi:hypothetical protein
MVGGFEALLAATPNLERLSLNCVASAGRLLISQTIQYLIIHIDRCYGQLLILAKLHPIHYIPGGNIDFGGLLARVDAPNLTHLEVGMWSLEDFEILTLCRKTFQPVTN